MLSALLPARAGRVSGAVGVLAAAGCIAILAVIIARFQDVGYAFSVSPLLYCISYPSLQVYVSADTQSLHCQLSCSAQSPHESGAHGLLTHPACPILPCAPPFPAPQVAFIVLASTIPIGMPVVVGAVLAVGAREMVAEKAIVSR